MYEIRKKFEVAGAHMLDLPYESPCKNLHGHNWWITIYVKAEELQNGMVIDFAEIKRRIHGALDHSYINEVVKTNPTAENIAKWICEKVEEIREGVSCYRVDVEESSNNTAIYYKE